MVVNLNLNKLGARLAFLIAVLVCCALLFAIIVSRVVVGTLADDRVNVTRDMLQIPIQYFPGSARLNSRMAAAELSESDRDLERAKEHAERAVNLSPYDYRFRLTLASVQEASGDRASAEESLKAARRLAPNYWNVHYRLANLLVRQGKLGESLDDFRIAVASNGQLVRGTLDLVWRASQGDVDSLRAVSGTDPKARLALAQFLLKASLPEEAAEVFDSIDRSDRIALLEESSRFLNELISVGQLATARDLWADLAEVDGEASLVWNGSFELDPQMGLSQFDWSFGRSEYARLALDTAVAHSGLRSLRIDFAGRDTTQLDNEIRQLVPVRSGAKYTVQCYVRTSGLETPEGPQVVVTDRTSSNWLAATRPVPQGSSDWQPLTLEFVAPKDNLAVFVSIKRRPKFSYDEPTSGIVWFDDFTIKQQ